MTSPEADLVTVSEIIAVKGDGDITEFPGAVDFVQGSAMAGGVFVTVRVDDERICEDSQYLKLGKKVFHILPPVSSVVSGIADLRSPGSPKPASYTGAAGPSRSGFYDISKT